MKVYFDTNVIVAAVRPSHVHNATALPALIRAQKNEIAGHLSGHGLTEIYSVLTRAPFIVPVYTKDVLALLQQSVLPYFTIIDVTNETHLTAIASCAAAGWKGGRIHDTVHIQAAAQAQCDLIYTYDVAHFVSLAPEWSNRIQNPPPA